MCRYAVLFGVLSLLIAAPTEADYIVTPLVEGMSSVTVEWGDSFTLDLDLSSDAGDTHNSAIIDVIFAEPGILYEAYEWAAPYVTAPPYDDSAPILAALPLLLDADTLAGPGYPDGVVDVELSNVLIGGTFGEGTLVSLDLTVPADFGYEGSVFIAASPDTIADGFDVIPSTGGQVFELVVVPEPSGGAVLLAVFLGVLRYRRRRGL